MWRSIRLQLATPGLQFGWFGIRRRCVMQNQLEGHSYIRTHHKGVFAIIHDQPGVLLWLKYTFSECSFPLTLGQCHTDVSRKKCHLPSDVYVHNEVMHFSYRCRDRLAAAGVIRTFDFIQDVLLTVLRSHTVLCTGLINCHGCFRHDFLNLFTRSR